MPESAAADRMLRQTISGELPVAWKCEACHRWWPVSIGSSTILVEDVADRWTFSGSIKSKGRFLRRMVVDPACRRKMVDGPTGD